VGDEKSISSAVYFDSAKQNVPFFLRAVQHQKPIHGASGGGGDRDPHPHKGKVCCSEREREGEGEGGRKREGGRETETETEREREGAITRGQCMCVSVRACATQRCGQSSADPGLRALHAPCSSQSCYL